MVIKYLLFDCDNTLVKSEDLAFEACADLINEVMEIYGVNQHYTGESLITKFVGQNFRGMMTALQKQFDFRLEQDELEKYVQTEVDRVVEKLEAKAEPCDGSMKILASLSKDDRYKMAVVSSSALRRVRVSMARTGQDKFFNTHEIYSAANSLPKPTSKPDPAIYLHVLQKHQAKPEECVAVEDSISGATSAIRAKIPVIGYVGAYNTAVKRAEMSGRLTELGCKNIMYDWADFNQCLMTVAAGKD